MTIDTMKLAEMANTQDGMAKIRKMTKQEIIDALGKNAFYPNHYKNQVDELNKKLNQRSNDEVAARIMLASFVGMGLEIDDYSGQVDFKKLNLLDLVGKVCAKCVNDHK